MTPKLSQSAATVRPVFVQSWHRNGSTKPSDTQYSLHASLSALTVFKVVMQGFGTLERLVFPQAFEHEPGPAMKFEAPTDDMLGVLNTLKERDGIMINRRSHQMLFQHIDYPFFMENVRI